MEQVGIINEIIDNESGFILGLDDNEYYFSIADFLEPIPLQLTTKVVFKPIIVGEVKKAILISNM